MPDTLLLWIPKANPFYEDKLHRIERWLVEFESDGLPHREIGLDAEGTPVIHGPTEGDYGFWLDTNMTYEAFEGQPICKEEFERSWDRAGSI